MPTLSEPPVWLAIATSSVVSAALSLFITGWRENRKDKREMRADGLNVARALEEYVRSCARMLVESSYAVSKAHEQHEYRPMDGINLPAFVAPEAGWKYFTPSLADRIKGLPDSIRDHDAELGDRWRQDDIEDKFELVDEIDRLAIKFGHEAWDLAEAVRTEFGLPADHVRERMAAALETLRKAREVQAAHDLRRAALSDSE